MGLLKTAAMTLKYQEPGVTYLLLQMGNHLRSLMRGDEPLEEWNRVYVGQDREPFDIEALLPSSPEV